VSAGVGVALFLLAFALGVAGVVIAFESAFGKPPRTASPFRSAPPVHELPEYERVPDHDLAFTKGGSEVWVIEAIRYGKLTQKLHYGDSTTAFMVAAWVPGWSAPGATSRARRASNSDVERLADAG
jgi:hypothetical protein